MGIQREAIGTTACAIILAVGDTPSTDDQVFVCQLGSGSAAMVAHFGAAASGQEEGMLGSGFAGELALGIRLELRTVPSS